MHFYLRPSTILQSRRTVPLLVASASVAPSSATQEGTMKTKRCVGAWALITAAVVSSPFWRSMEGSAQSARPALNGPQFEVDPSWPKQLPERWVTGELGGVCVDANDHVFVLSRANLYDGIKEIAQAAPAVMEFDQTGNVVNSWGDRQVMAEQLHGCSFDPQGNIWIAGNG